MTTFRNVALALRRGCAAVSRAFHPRATACLVMALPASPRPKSLPPLIARRGVPREAMPGSPWKVRMGFWPALCVLDNGALIGCQVSAPPRVRIRHIAGVSGGGAVRPYAISSLRRENETERRKTNHLQVPRDAKIEKQGGRSGLY